jgi:hypothetical protein
MNKIVDLTESGSKDYRLLRLNVYQKNQVRRMSEELKGLLAQRKGEGIIAIEDTALEERLAVPECELTITDLEELEAALYRLRPYNQILPELSVMVADLKRWGSDFDSSVLRDAAAAYCGTIRPENLPHPPENLADADKQTWRLIAESIASTLPFPPDEAKVRQAVIGAVRELRRINTSIAIQRRKRRLLLTNLVSWSMGWFFVTCLFGAEAQNAIGSPTWANWALNIRGYMLILATMSGGLGGLISSISAVAAVDPVAQGSRGVEAVEEAGQGSRIGVVSGLVFSLVLFFLISGGLLQGALFPRFTAPPPGYPEHWVSLLTQDNFGKLIVWAFSAGYVGSLVPGVLRKLTDEAQDNAIKPNK